VLEAMPPQMLISLGFLWQALCMGVVGWLLASILLWHWAEELAHREADIRGLLYLFWKTHVKRCERSGQAEMMLFSPYQNNPLARWFIGTTLQELERLTQQTGECCDNGS
jgi:hypothetical protein